MTKIPLKNKTGISHWDVTDVFLNTSDEINPPRLKPHKTVALICYGTGMTAKALTSAGIIEQIDIVDVSNNVLDMNDVVFPDPEEKPTNDPRVHIHVEDGRFFLLTTEQKYDLITGEPPPPHYRGIVNLYTQEYFQLIYNRLNEGGIVTYWLPVSLLDNASAKSVLKAFCNVFEDCTLWEGTRTNWMMMGTRNIKKPVSKEQFVRQWNNREVDLELKTLGFDSPEKFGSYFIADSGRINNWISDSPPLVDNYPHRLPTITHVASEDIDHFDMFANSLKIKNIFLESKDIANIWPSSIRQKTGPHFPRSRILFDKIPESSLALVKKLNRIISDPHSTSFNLFYYLGSDAYAQNILENKFDLIKQPSAEIIRLLNISINQSLKEDRTEVVQELIDITNHLSARSIYLKDYRSAEMYYNFLSNFKSIHDKQNIYYLRMYFSQLAGNQERVLEIKEELLNFSTIHDLVQEEPIEIFWQWLSKL